jgi:protein-disulfide isomerase
MQPTFSFRAAFAAALCFAAFLLAAIVPAQAISPQDRPAIEQIIREYLLSNPEVLRDAMMELQRREAEAESKQRSAAVKEHEKLIYESPRGVVVGNRSGDVTIVEFFDYNCGYCKRALDDMMLLMKDDPKLKFVLKEFPVLGEGSVQAAQISIAVRMQDKDGSKYLPFHQKLLATRGQIDGAKARAVAKEVGIDMAQLDRDLKSDEIRATLVESHQLADALGINGTPSYVIGGEVVPGAVGAKNLRTHVESVRKCGKAAC